MSLLFRGVYGCSEEYFYRLGAATSSDPGGPPRFCEQNISNLNTRATIDIASQDLLLLLRTVKQQRPPHSVYVIAPDNISTRSPDRRQRRERFLWGCDTIQMEITA